MPSTTIADRFRCMLTVTWFLFSLLLSSLVLTIVMILTLGKAQNFMVKYIGLFVGRTGLTIAGIKLVVHNPNSLPDRPVMYIFNHSSTLDLFVLLSLGLHNVRFVAKREFQLNPFFFILGNLTGQIFIPRDKSQRSVQILKKACDRIKKKKLSMVMGPEGSRKHPGVIGPFKKGAFYLACDLSYPIVPLYFENASELCQGRSLITKKGTVNAYIHPAIETASWNRDEVAHHVKQIRNQYLKWANVLDTA
ncbi:MAG: lysophospholipid acyltransferase family protein [Balneolales bacterium]